MKPSTLRARPDLRTVQEPSIRSVNPATNKLLQAYYPLDSAQIDAKISLAREAFHEYRTSPLQFRAQALRKAAKLLESDEVTWARLISNEMGKLLLAAREEVLKCARTCRYYADNGERFLAPQEAQTDAERSYVLFQPLGAVLAIMPWNFPFWQVFRFAAPAVMAGNVALLKHASNVPQCALAIEQIFAMAGFPQGVFQTLLIGSGQVQQILDDPRVAAVTLTGSDLTGSKVASATGKQLKKTVLELGGSDPFIVMPSTDLDETVKAAVKARTLNSGQSCVAAKRFLIHEAIYQEFERKLVEQMNALKVGNPIEDEIQIGPLATPDILDTVERQVEESIRKGASLLTGGKRLPGGGNFYAPTVLGNIPKDSPAYQEEVFGPVALLFKVSDLEEAIRIANDSRYGLGSSLWSKDPAEHEKFIREIEAGMAFVNGIVASDPRIPFGGVKHSGYGRELSHYGLQEFVNIKTVVVNKPSPASAGPAQE